jgi:hypothetical protein
MGPGCGGTGLGSVTDSIVFIADPFRYLKRSVCRVLRSSAQESRV